MLRRICTNVRYNSSPSASSIVNHQPSTLPLCIDILPKLSTEQKTLLDLLKSGQNVYFTGKAGTGKTIVLKHFINYLKAENIIAAITAPTGSAASLINGQTLHSFASIPIRIPPQYQLVKKIISNKQNLKRYIETQVLIIDEISMLNPAVFDMISQIAIELRGDDRAFGGMQVVLCGDFFQLPPISDTAFKAVRTEMREESSFLRLIHPSNSERHLGFVDHINDDNSYVFGTFAWIQLMVQKMKIVELKEAHRQVDPKFLSLLDDFRFGIHSPESWAFLNQYKNVDFDQGLEDGFRPTYLAAYRNTADLHNSTELYKIKSKAREYQSIEQVSLIDQSNQFWPETCSSNLGRAFHSFQSKRSLLLKVGAQVILVKNINMKGGLSNGSRGVVVYFKSCFDDLTKQTLDLPVVRFVCGRTFIVGYQNFESYLIADGLLVNRMQLPLKLGWGITIHKSQGMTLDRAVIDLERSFSPGHAYVALSRIKNLDGLSIKRLGPQSLWTSSKVKEFYKKVICPLQLM